jgi:alginate O-acetyltransferase complex protein AlgI
MIQNLDWWIYLLLAPVVYWLAPARFRAGLLSIASLVVLFTMAPVDMAQMSALALLVYGSFAWFARPALAVAGQTPPARPAKAPYVSWLFLIVFIFFFWYKYAPVLARYIAGEGGIADIIAPIGISYYSFKLIHYVLERGRNNLPEHRLQDYVSWLFLMPTFTSGPIERFDHFVQHRAPQFEIAFVIEGVTRIVQGLVKRFVLVDLLARAVAWLTGGNLADFTYGLDGQPGVWPVWAFLLVALVRLYLDFSAYSDIAIGVSRLFGFRIMENFSYPLLATSLTDFWTRWHMSLTSWCRVYIYMPVVGLTRNPYYAVIATFALVGLWHSGTHHWLAWGLWHGVGQAGVQHWGRIASRRKIKFFKKRLGKFIGWALTLIYVMFGGCLVAFYNVGSFMDSFRLMGRAFGL